MTVSSPPDRIERFGFPGPPVSARPLAACENTLGSIVAAGLHDIFERPAGHAVFEQIGVAVQGRLEMGLRVTSTPVHSSDVGSKLPKLSGTASILTQETGCLQENLEHLRVEGDKWVQFDLVDTIVHANMMFETIDSVKRCLQDDGLPRQEIYPDIIPPSDLPYLPSMLRVIENDVALRTKAIHLRGNMLSYSSISYCNLQNQRRRMKNTKFCIKKYLGDYSSNSCRFGLLSSETDSP
ncbi:hypothetical protein BS47DRAFT_1386195 [Hydnum rufescens UP504]|uniref:Uncharacterized protein n=1 Tax=Hydnum rufescens UP504 TaxID=1448309 RepID=A0A9P6AF38_9AGAM|nr:hypothetical protein BS47DRAFT_1386195 [Hydnum rufescens UP504]